MPPTLITLRDSINKAFLRLKPARPAIEEFKKNLITLLDRLVYELYSLTEEEVAIVEGEG